MSFEQTCTFQRFQRTLQNQKNLKHFLSFLGPIIKVDLDNKGVEFGKGFECVD